MNIDELLNKHVDNNYKEFHKKICNTKYKVLGIKIPILKKVSKDLLKRYNYEEIIKNLNSDIYEHVMLEGLIIANAKIDSKEKLKLIKKYVKKIDNWAICDTFCASLKMFKNNQDKYLEEIEKYLNSSKEYYLRFGIVILLLYYINDEYIDYVLNICKNIKSDYYYVKMAISWTISICIVKYFDKTIKYLENNKNEFDMWTYNKSLQKARESYRIKENNKNILKSMKRLS